MTWFASLWERVFAHAWRLLFRRRRPDSSQPPVTNAPQEKKKHSPERPALLSLPDDVLLEIIYRLTHSPHPTRTNSMNLVEQHTYKNGLPLATTCTKLASVFYNSLDNVCLSSTNVNDAAIQSLATNASDALRRLVLRDCHVSNNSLFALKNAPYLRSLDLSFVRSIDHVGLTAFCNAAAPRLTTLLLRLCPGVNDAAMNAVAKCRQLHTLDVSYCKQLTDTGIRRVVSGCGSSLRLLAVAHIPCLTDQSFAAIGTYCTNLLQLCARGLQFVTDIGFASLCEGVGKGVEGIDVTACNGLTRDATLSSLRLHCPKIYTHIMPAFAARSLRQIIISTLRQNIFIVHGSDPTSGNETVHTVLIDNGDIVSASLLSSGTIDLSLLGVVLCKSYGSGLNDDTKKMLEIDYGIPTISLTD
ncbi:F-box/LRR-repeat protein 2 [Gracilariopsis chorda]|uniref:F-box/LRR-repeat protein 2 n=1 Tax=Gracilariopsis chorda TaxID=448386 RepID=A0A2V3J0R2_9FLOR|nr:F-box/LRR-repeat protein 2 [Gracilariopsis chorda]|eukprot:PXF47517.1 F-box/LRR-repeat protein 2 [Gracilariopsis chorda]